MEYYLRVKNDATLIYDLTLTLFGFSQNFLRHFKYELPVLVVVLDQIAN